MLHDFLGTKISEGGLHCLIDRLASKGTDAYELIRQRILKSSVIGTDETGMKVNGKKHWFWTWQNNHATFIDASTNRGTATIEKHVANMSNDITWPADYKRN